MKRLEEALKFVPLEEKLGLLEAMRAAPHLVTRESDITRFLLQAGGAALPAAQRLCRYWNERRRAYGLAVAFLPLDVTAARPPDVHDLRDGRTVTLLPPDDSGASVLYYDKTQASNRALLLSDACRARVLFYACQKLSENPVSQMAGCVLILRVDPTESAQALRFHKAHIELGHLLAHVFPLEIKAWHIVALLDEQHQLDQTLWVQQTLPVLLARWEAILGKAPQHIHAGPDDATICASLRQYGLRMDRLPRSSSDHQSMSALTTTTTPTNDSGAAAAAGTSSFKQPPLPHKKDDAKFSPSSKISETRVSRAGSLSSANSNNTDSKNSNSNKKQRLLPSNNEEPTPDWQRNTLQNAEGFGVLDDPEMRQQGLKELADAVGFLPEHQTAAYLQAQRVCPELVEIESDPLMFLRFHRYNAWSAAQQITTYWTKRREIFKERAFLPMTMTGDGAMNQDDITFLRTGYFCFLPPDRDGRTVICYDPSRRTHHTKESRMRIGFYLWSIICENETCIRNGYVGIVVLGNGSFGVSSLDGAIRECVDIVVDCFPTEAKNIHLVQVVRPMTARRSLLQMLLPLLLNVMGRLLEKAGVTHAPDSQIEMAQEFESYGVSPSGLPVSVGGTWTHDEFYQWQLERCRVERKRYQWSLYGVVPAGAVPSTALAAADSAPMTFSTPLSSLFMPQQQHQLQQDLAQLELLIRRLPQGEGAAYLEASAKAPALVRDESRPAWFCTQGDLRAAARQLAAYWSLRKRLFGDRAFLPMAQTGEGALGRKELTLLNSGFFTVLPTKQNETVIVTYDCAKDDTTDEIGRLRVAFYTLSLAAERDISRSRGLCIVASGLKELAKLKEEGAITSNVTFEALLDVMPIRVSVIHIAMLLLPVTVSYPLDSTVEVMRSLFGSAGKSKGIVHVGTSRDEFAEQLVPYGIEKSILPRYLGGTFGYDRFTQWQELRIRYEWGLPAGANDRDALEIYDFSKVKLLSDMSEEERKERKRRMNVVHSRRKRERERIEIEVLQEQCDELRDRRVVLTEETHRLEGLLRHAQAAISTATPTEDSKHSPKAKGS
mmetsp:Transcript_3977/g.8002  ORF Transcript_3977/g.8002 Transcript_3977/m.8002 type:complete len:1060 (+) Transcript_3977:157-3336(+)